MLPNIKTSAAKVTRPDARREMMLMLLFVLSCVPAVKTCLQCEAKIRRMHESFILSTPSIADQIELKKICDHAYATYKNASQHRKGIIDATTLYRARTEYESEFDSFLKSPRTGSITFAAIQMFDKGRKILEKHLDKFISEGLCPNKCGLLERRVIDCISCQYKKHICPSPQTECGDTSMLAVEGGQAVLDCFQPWHNLLLGEVEYHFSWVPAAPGPKRVFLIRMTESELKPLVVTEDSYLVLNQLRLDEQGTYRCSLEGRNGIVFYRVLFLLSVSPRLDKTDRVLITPPPLPVDDYYLFGNAEAFLVPFLAVITGLSLAVVVGLTIFLGLMVNKWSDEEESNPEAPFLPE